jgi:4-amino-4-deoxy-L-arabinose transferase-like glycosyltransferase
MPPKSPGPWQQLGAALAIAAAVLLAYAPALGGGFVWDDHVLVEQNPLLTGPLSRIWLTADAADFWPLSYSALWVEWRLFGADPTGYHLVNVLLHATTAVLFWRVLRRLQVPGAWLAALLFAVHPVAVESVAWTSELKNMLSGPLYAGTILAWLRSREEGGRPWYAAALGLFVLAVLAKTSTVVLPVVLVGILLYRERRLHRRDLDLVPFFAVSLASGLATIWFQWTRAMLGTPSARALVERIGGSAWALAAYLQKAYVPVDLALVYAPWPVDPSSRWFYVPLALVPAAAALAWLARNGPARPVIFALAFHAVVVLPVLGILDMVFLDFSPIANHLQYLALIGPATLAAFGLARLAERPAARRVALAGAGALVVALGVDTAFRSTAFADDLTLWRRAEEDGPQSLTAAWMYAEYLGRGGRGREALEAMTAAAERLRAPDARHRARALVLLQRRFVDEAVAEASAAAALRPDAMFDHELASMLVQAGRPESAIPLVEPLVRAAPRSTPYRVTLATALAEAGRTGEAADVLREACRVSEGRGESCRMFAELVQSVRGGDGRRDVAAALGRRPDDPGLDAVLAAPAPP